MSFFALLTLVPSTVAVGAALGFLERFVGPQQIARGQDEAIAALRLLMSPRLTDGSLPRSCERSSASSAAASRSAVWS
jgi:hypothetical protein